MSFLPPNGKYAVVVLCTIRLTRTKQVHVNLMHAYIAAWIAMSFTKLTLMLFTQSEVLKGVQNLEILHEAYLRLMFYQICSPVYVINPRRSRPCKTILVFTSSFDLWMFSVKVVPMSSTETDESSADSTQNFSCGDAQSKDDFKRGKCWKKVFYMCKDIYFNTLWRP